MFEGNALLGLAERLRGVFLGRNEFYDRTAGLRVITSGMVTLQPSLATNNWLYTNTQITIPATTGPYHVLTAITDAPATIWITDQTATSFIIWAAIDTELTTQAATPTIWYLVIQ